MTHYEILHPHECAQDKPEDDSVMKVYVRDSITSDDDGWVVYKKGIERIVAYMYVSHIGSRVLDVRFFAPQTDPGQDEAYELDPPDRWIKLDVSAYLASRKPTVKDLLIAELELRLGCCRDASAGKDLLIAELEAQNLNMMAMFRDFYELEFNRDECWEIIKKYGGEA